MDPASMVIGGGLQIIGGIMASSAAKKEAARREREAARLQSKLNRLEANRQQIINPYEGRSPLRHPYSNQRQKPSSLPFEDIIQGGSNNSCRRLGMS